MLPGSTLTSGRASPPLSTRYFDLRQNRTSDYKFSYKKMLARNGDTAVYMQYAHARIASMARKAGVDPTTLDPSLVDLEHQSAVDLAYHIAMFQVRLRPPPRTAHTRPGCLVHRGSTAVRLACFVLTVRGCCGVLLGVATAAAAAPRQQEVVSGIQDDVMPHHLCEYLFKLANQFSDFYSNCRVVGDPKQNRCGAAAACDACSRNRRVVQECLR